MSTLERNTEASPSIWNQIERQLLTDVRTAEAAFKQATGTQKDQAGEQYRLALARFTELVLDRRLPSDLRLAP
jgi:hypothetical protein